MKKEKNKLDEYWTRRPRLPLPKQRHQVFSVKTKYNRKKEEKGSRQIPLNFIMDLLLKLVPNKDLTFHS